MSLLKLLPIGTVLRFQDKDFRYHGWFTVALGGYATIEAARFISEGKEVYFSLEIVDDQFSLHSMLERMRAETFGSLAPEMQQFVVNHFNSQKKEGE